MVDIFLAIIAALDDEVRIIRSKMEIDTRVHVRPALFETGKYAAKPLLLVRSGIGPAAMAKAIDYCLDRYSPKFCLHIGYCGGADPKFQAGDLIIADAVADDTSKKRYKSDPAIVEKALGLCKEKKLRAFVATLVTVEKVIASPHEKAFVGTEHEAQGIDMESSALAAHCTERGVSYLVVRAVLDPLDTELPGMDGAIDEEGKTNIAAIAEIMLKNPGEVLKFPRLQYFASEARASLTTFADAWIGY